MIPSYGKIYNLSRTEVAPIFEGDVTIQEKVDGSQFSFMKDASGEVHFRSRSVSIHPGEGGMFSKGMDAVMERRDAMEPGLVYRGEYLQKPKHNVLAYDRVPRGHVILFDAHTLDWRERPDLVAEGRRLDLEVVPVISVFNVDQYPLRQALDRLSVLGGSKIEGVVIKNYSLTDRHTGLPLMAKLVGEAFLEVKDSDWKDRNPGSKDVIGQLIEKYRSEARWRKAVQHLQEAGKLTGTRQDIGPLIKEVIEDVKLECSDEIKEALFRWFWKQAAKSMTTGLPEWYKKELGEV